MNNSVTVVIPAYNVEAYLPRAVKSALSQTLMPIEVLVVDDASTDRTLEVACQWSQVRVLRHSNNKGPSASRNHAIREAKGDWVAFLDADDWWAPNRLEVLVRVAKELDVHLVADNLWFVEEGREMPWTTAFHEKGYHLRSPKLVGLPDFRDFNFSQLHFMIDRQFLCHSRLLFAENLKYLENLTFILSCHEAGGKIGITPLALYYYQSRAGSMTDTREAAYAHRIQAMEQAHLYVRSPDGKKVLLKTLTDFEHAVEFLKWRKWVVQGDWKDLWITSVRHPDEAWRFALSLAKSLKHRWWKRKAHGMEKIINTLRRNLSSE